MAKIKLTNVLVPVDRRKRGAMIEVDGKNIPTAWLKNVTVSTDAGSRSLVTLTYHADEVEVVSEMRPMPSVPHNHECMYIDNKCVTDEYEKSLSLDFRVQAILHRIATGDERVLTPEAQVEAQLVLKDFGIQI